MTPAEYAFVVGASHSGTTLLTLLLNAHPDVATVGELTSGARRNVEAYRCSCRTPILQCSFWRRLSEQMASRHAGFELSTFGISFEPPLPRWLRRLTLMEHRGRALEAVRGGLLGLSPTWRRHLRELESRCAAIVRAVLDLRQARVFVDSSKLPHRFRFIRQMRSFRTRAIHLVRDGRAVALTYMDQDGFGDANDPSFRRGGYGPQAAPAAGLSMPRAAEEWRRSQRAAEFALRTVAPERRLRVRYEDLCRKPPAVLDSIFGFLGVDPARSAPDFRAVEHHIVGNGMRLDAGSEVRLDERWRSVLGRADLLAFDAVAGDVNRGYGYE